MILMCAFATFLIAANTGYVDSFYTSENTPGHLSEG